MNRFVKLYSIPFSNVKIGGSNKTAQLRRLQVDYELLLGEKYAHMIAKFLESNATGD